MLGYFFSKDLSTWLRRLSSCVPVVQPNSETVPESCFARGAADPVPVPTPASAAIASARPSAARPATSFRRDIRFSPFLVSQCSWGSCARQRSRSSRIIGERARNRGGAARVLRPPSGHAHAGKTGAKGGLRRLVGAVDDWRQ